MNILHFYRTYFPDTHGGLEQVIRQVCTSTLSPGITPRVLSLSRESHKGSVEDFDGIGVVRSKLSFEIASCGVSLESFSMFRRQLEWADIVHYHFPWPFADFLHLLYRVKKPALVTYHSDIVRQRFLRKLYEPLMFRFLDKVDAIVATSPNYFATSPVLGQYSDKVEIIPIGLDEDSYIVRKGYDLSTVEKVYGSNFFLFVGVLRYYKGLHILIDAMKNTSYKVIIAGAGPVEQELKRHVKALGLTNVIFTGYIDEALKEALYRLCKAVVFPSYLRSEAFGVTLLEGAMHGKPLISTEVGTGTSFINQNGVTGLVVEPSSAHALREAMTFLHQNPIDVQRMGRAARKRYEKHFTGYRMGKKYIELYSRLLAAK